MGDVVIHGPAKHSCIYIWYNFNFSQTSYSHSQLFIQITTSKSNTHLKLTCPEILVATPPPPCLSRVSIKMLIMITSNNFYFLFVSAFKSLTINTYYFIIRKILFAFIKNAVQIYFNCFEASQRMQMPFLPL